MKLYSLVTDSHQVLLKEWFLPSLKDSFELVIEEKEQYCVSADFMSAGWIETMILKVDLILRAICENPGGVFVYSDVDVQFFEPVKALIEEAMRGRDFAVQFDSLKGKMCAGFFACRGNSKTKKLWQDIRYLLLSLSRNDQELLNDLLTDIRHPLYRLWVRRKSVQGRCPGWITALSNPYLIRWRYLPEVFVSGGSLAGGFWEPGMPLEIPSRLVMHHANWTVGISHKIAQLQRVRVLYQQSKNPTFRDSES